ncbi:retrovirus-related pol polyprotein from transposon TNT 1-94, partial [Tanacetum coccineum]
CLATRRSTSGYYVFLGDNLLTWSSKREDMLSCSSAEAEYRGVANAVAEASWIRNLLRELHTPLFTATLVHCDNVSAVYMSANPMQHQRTKHIEIDIHFIRDKVAAGHVRVLHVPSRFQLRFALAFWLLKTAFWLLRFASRFGCVLPQDHCVLPQDHCVLPQDHHCVLLQHLVAFCFKTIIAFWGKENGLQIIPSIDQGSFELGTIKNTLRTTSERGLRLGPERPYTYDDLDDNQKKRYNADVRETNIVLQGLPKDIYKLINHNIEAKAIWDNVKMLLAGSGLTKEDRESQLYDEFERFKMLPGENINEYYVRFHKLVNDIRNIWMTMPNIQLNSKFVNNMSPEWDRFITIVKLNKGLKETNHEQLYAYLKQYEKHAAQDRLIIKRITLSTNDPLPFVSSFRGMQNRARNVNASQGKPIKCYNYNGIGHIARNCTQPKRLKNSDYFKDKMLLMQAQENGVVLDEEELLFLAGEQGNTFDADVDNQLVHDLALNEDNIFQADECDAFDSDFDDEPTTQTISMANLSSASVTNQNEHEIHNEVQQSNVINSTSVHMGNSNVIPYEQYLTTNDVSVIPSYASLALNNAYVLIDNIVHIPHELMDDQMRVLIHDRNGMEEKLKKELHFVKLQLNHSIKSQTVVQENVNTLQQTFKQRESQLLNDYSNLRKLKDKLKNKLHAQDQSIQTVHMMLKPKRLCGQYSELPIDVPSSEEDQELAELTRQKMHEKLNDPVCVEKRIKCIPPNYSKENFLATFTPQTQLTPEQVF